MATLLDTWRRVQVADRRTSERLREIDTSISLSPTPDVERLRAYFRDTFSGVHRRGQPLVLSVPTDIWELAPPRPPRDLDPGSPPRPPSSNSGWDVVDMCAPRFAIGGVAGVLLVLWAELWLWLLR